MDTNVPATTTIYRRILSCLFELELKDCLAILIAFVVCGGATGYLFSSNHRVRHTSFPTVLMDVRDDSLMDAAPLWQKEVTRRFPNAVVILCHGGSFVKGEWIIQDFPGDGAKCENADKVLNDEQAEYPNRTIVLLACNTAHLELHGHPNCYYFPSEVWVVPDRDYNPGAESPFERMLLSGNKDSIIDLRSTDDPNVCGNIFEALEAN